MVRHVPEERRLALLLGIPGVPACPIVLICFGQVEPGLPYLRRRPTASVAHAAVSRTG